MTIRHTGGNYALLTIDIGEGTSATFRLETDEKITPGGLKTMIKMIELGLLGDFPAGTKSVTPVYAQEAGVPFLIGDGFDD